MKQKHREKFPNTGILDSDAEEWDKYITEFRPRPTTGKELLAARRAAIAGKAARMSARARNPVQNAASARTARDIGKAVATAAYAVELA